MFRSLLACLALGLSLAASLAAGADPQRPPNLIFVLADDLGYGEVGCFGAKLIQTPHLDRMAAEGARCTQFYAGSTVCAPSRSVLMTGLHTGHTRVRGNAGKLNRDPQNLRAEDITVAEVLQQAGYATALIGKWGLGHEGSQGLPNQQGFDYFYGYLDQVHAHNPYPPFIMRNTARVPLRNKTVPGSGGQGEAEGAGIAEEPLDFVPDLMAAEALQWVEQQKDKPFFLYWSLILPHANNEGSKFGRGQEVPDFGPYAGPAGPGQADRADWTDADRGHAAAITRLDADLGRLFALLKKLALDENTLVVFSSDNGPHKEGGYDLKRFEVSGPLRGLKRDLTEGGIRVPTIMRWPGRIAPASEIATPLWFADILPTFAELAGAPTAALPARLDGQSFAKPLRGLRVAWPGPRNFYWEYHEGGFSQAVLINGRYKALRLKRRDAPLEIYDLKNDLREQTNLAPTREGLTFQAETLFTDEHTDSPDWPIKDGPVGGKKK